MQIMQTYIASNDLALKARVSALEFFDHKFREITGNRVIFSCLLKCLLQTPYNLYDIKLEFFRHLLVIKLLHGL